jgi:hypothetical protein
MDEISTMNKYSELYWVVVRSLVYNVPKTVHQVCELGNTFIYDDVYSVIITDITYTNNLKYVIP